MGTFSVGDTVRVGHVEAVVRCRAARAGWYFLINKLPHLPVPVTRIAKGNELRLIAKGASC